MEAKEVLKEFESNWNSSYGVKQREVDQLIAVTKGLLQDMEEIERIVNRPEIDTTKVYLIKERLDGRKTN